MIKLKSDIECIPSEIQRDLKLTIRQSKKQLCKEFIDYVPFNRLSFLEFWNSNSERATPMKSETLHEWTRRLFMRARNDALL